MILNSLKKIVSSPIYQAFSPENLAEGIKKGVPKALGIGGQAIKSQGQGLLRNFARVGGMASGQTLTPETQFQKDLFGTDKPLTFRSGGAEFGLSEKNKFAPALGFASAALDVLPSGQIGKNAAAQALKNLNKTGDAFKVLKKVMGMSTKVAQKYAPEAAKLTSEKQLNNLIDNAIKESQDIIEIGKRAGTTAKSLLKTAKAVDDPTKKELIEAIDYIRLKKPYSQKMEENVGLLAEKYGIANKDLNTVANKFQDLVEKTKTTGGEMRVLTPAFTKGTDGKFTGSLGTYKGEKDLTTKILKDLEGKTTVSKQYILDATNRGELKQVERDLIREVLSTEKGDTINVSDFAKKVKAELLPLKTKESYIRTNGMNQTNSGVGKYSPQYESISLPDDLRGKVKNYQERIYESPIKTSAGNTHFSGKEADNYFGHTRIEDMADNKTRRVIEVQSDLYQKGRLENELADKTSSSAIGVMFQGEKMKGLSASEALKATDKKIAEINKLQQYNDPTAHFRMVREEIKKAAQDGKTKLQFPTGETAMKIEGLGVNADNWLTETGRASNRMAVADLKVGREIARVGEQEKWIITDVLGDGKFKAVPKVAWNNIQDIKRAYGLKGADKVEQTLNRYEEAFDISGKVDTNNPIYKFYEKDVQKYLNKFGGKRVVDDKGVSWIEVPVDKKYATAPVEAFGGFAGIEQDEEGKISFDPKKAALGVVGMTAASKFSVSERTNVFVKKLTDAIKKAEPVRGKQEALYSAERARRAAAVAGAGKRVKGEGGYFAQLGQLKGPLPKVQFESIRNLFKQDEVDALFDTIENTKFFSPFEKVTTKGGLAKLFSGEVPTRGELDLMKEVFPPEMIEEILKKRPLGEKIFALLGQALNVPRAIMASVDLSAPLRQGVFLTSRPKQFAPAFGNMFKYAFSEKAFEGLEESIKARPTYELMRRAKLAVTNLGNELSSREEAIMSNLPEKIPGLGKLFRGSNRAYAGFLNKLRADVFDDIVKKAKLAGKDVNDEELKGLGKFVNAATGRGSFGLKETLILPKAAERAAPVLNSIFFSPRLMASRLNLLNPIFYATLTPIARKEALKSLFGFTGIMGSVLGLAALNDKVDVGADPRSADFGKIKIDNTRYDILGGFQQYIKLVAQLGSGEVVSSTTGRTITLGEGYKPLTRKDIALRFFESKEAPVTSFITGLLSQQTPTGKDFDVPTEVVNRFIPMIVQDLHDLAQEEGAENLYMGLPAIFGAGTQTYGKQELAIGENKIGEPSSQIRPVQELSEKIREKIVGEIPLGTSKGFSVETYFDQLSNLPREEAAEIFDQIATSNPELAKKLVEVVKEREKGITPHDKDLKAKGVASGDRALTIKKELDKLETKEEKATLWREYARKGVITKEVGRQLSVLLKEN